MPPLEPDYQLVRERLKRERHRRRLNLRDAADQIGLSPATLSRLERGAGRPDLPSLDAVIDWLGLESDAVYKIAPAPEPETTPERVEVLLRADRDLDEATARALSKTFQTLYRELSEREAR